MKNQKPEQTENNNRNKNIKRFYIIDIGNPADAQNIVSGNQLNNCRNQ